MKLFASIPLLLLFSLSLSAMDNQLVPVNNLIASHALGKVKLFHKDNQFLVEHNEQIRRVHSYDVEPALRKMTPAQLAAFQKIGYIQLKKLSNGEFKLNANVRGLGGGIGGAAFGVWLGKAVVYGVSYGVLGAAGAVATVVGGPAGAGVMYGVTLACAPFIEAASNVVAVGVGVTGAVVTGPV